MKPTYILPLMIFLILAAACSEPEAIPEPAEQKRSAENLIINTWNARLTIVDVYNSSGLLINSYDEDVNDVTYIFNADRTFVTSKPGHGSYNGRWALSGEDTFVFDGSNYHIDTLNQHTFHYHASYDTTINNNALRFITSVGLYR